MSGETQSFELRGVRQPAMADQDDFVTALSEFAHTQIGNHAASDALHDLSAQVTEIVAASGAGVSLVCQGGSLGFAAALDSAVAGGLSVSPPRAVADARAAGVGARHRRGGGIADAPRRHRPGGAQPLSRPSPGSDS